MAAMTNLNAMFIILFLVEVHADSGEIFISTSREDKHPCEFEENQCKYGTCRQTEKRNGRNFLCACPPKRTGTLCENSTNDCLKCKAASTIECTGFSDGTAVCICLEYTDRKLNAPSICYFMRKALAHRQVGCTNGNYKCERGQECVNYAQNDNNVAVVCQCPVGNTRGANCEQDYQVDVPGKVFSCVDTNMNGVICMCKKYGKRNDRYGFCKPKVVQLNLIAPLNDDGPCSFSNNKCRLLNSNCFQTDKNKFLCGCKSKYGGKYCHFETPHCAKCVKHQRGECLGLEDGTAVCICLEYSKQYSFKVPSLCYYPQAKPERQTDCKVGYRKCDPGQQCVNYAHGKKMQITCQCPVGRTRGKDCIEDYKFIDMANEQTDCLHSKNYGPFCLCYKYGKKGNSPGFCKPNVKVHGAVVKPRGSGGPCDISENKCRRGVCIETKPQKDWNFLCACPLHTTGALCHYEMIECTECEKKTDCIGLPDGTAVCICLALINWRRAPTPLICYYKKANSDRQKDCNACSPGEQCVNYAQNEKKKQIACQCPAGKKRGSRCSRDYMMDIPAGRFPCVDTLLHGPICLCDIYAMGYGLMAYGFCIPKLEKSAGYKLVRNAKRTLFKAVSPCDAKHKMCREGVCLEVEDGKDTNFICSCPIMKTGRLCTQETPHCAKCEKRQRVECLGLEDGTAVCICLEYSKQYSFKAPSLCYYPKAKPEKQQDCKVGYRKCDPGQQCVNNEHERNKMQITCQCPVGRSRGKDCIEDYKFIDMANEQTDCIHSENHGPFCLCHKYGKKGNSPGFCKPNVKVNGALVKPRGSGGPCDISQNRCHHGVCIETKPQNDWNFLCACPLHTTGALCHHEMIECTECERKTDCIGLPDGTAVCICLALINWRRAPTPLICYYKKANSDRQKSCNACSPGEQCVNYAQNEKKKQIACQCPAGKKRGSRCSRDYMKDIPAGRFACVDTILYGPICLCDIYAMGFGDMKYGFCIPKLKKTAVKNAQITLKADSPCDANHNICREGVCLEVEGGKDTDFICSCPFMKTGRLCTQDMHECTKCRESAREDCIGLPDGTAVCICVEFIKKNIAEEPAICYFVKYKKHRQKRCKKGDHNCSRGQTCVDYAQSKNKLQMTCQCPAGRKRGRNCNEDYRSIRSTAFSCVDTKKYGPICLCEEYGHGINKFGFCQPNLKKNDVGQKVKKISKRSAGQVTISNTTSMSTTADRKQVSTASALTSKTSIQPQINSSLHMLDRAGQVTISKTTSMSATADRKQVPTETALSLKTSTQPQINTSLHILDPGFKEDPCSSNPCLHGGLCKQHLSIVSQGFICVCPLHRKGKLCDTEIPDCNSVECKNTTDCISTPEGAMCICTVDYQQQFCSVKMRNVTEWEKVKLVITARTIQELDVVAIILLVLIGLAIVYLIRHCIQVSSKRHELGEKYEKVIKKGDIPTAPLPDWLDISNDLAKQTFCCGSSKLPNSFHQEKKKDKTEKDKHETNENSTENNRNENFPRSKRTVGNSHHINNNSAQINNHFKRGLFLPKHLAARVKQDKSKNFSRSKRTFGHSHHIRNNSAQVNNSCLERSLFLPENLASRVKHDTIKNKNQIRHEYVQEYIKKHQNYFTSTKACKDKLKGNYSQHVQAAEGNPRFTELWKKREFLDDTILKVPGQTKRNVSMKMRSKSAQR